MGAKCRVLIMDDNVDAADTLAEALTLEGYAVRVCYAAVDALHMAAAERPDVCILDIGLPEFDGHQLAEALRAIQGADPVLIALSGRDMPEDIETARSVGFDRFVAKPAKLETLVALFPN